MTENKTMTLSAHEGLIAGLAVSTVNGLVASASHDKIVKLWNLEALEREVVNDPEEILLSCDNDKDIFDSNKPLCDSLERLNSAKSKLAVKLREIVTLKRQIDDVPTLAEHIQYELCSSELYAHIQEKLVKTRKLYATYNALLETKDLMLKETSLLNSISLQFQDAIASPAGRLKLIDSMEGIRRGTQQKLDKVQVALQSEQRACDAVKARYTAVIAEKKLCDALLKAFQEECAKNERLQSSDALP